MTVVEILRDILVLLVAAKIAAELAERIKVPAVVGEIAAGMIIGPSVLGLVGPTEVLEVLAELGVILLLLQVGLEMDVRDLAAVGRASMSVAVVGVILPMAMGFGVGVAFGHDTNTALFLGAALAATSVGITARVFSDLRALTSVEARTVLGAAVADDVLGLVILTVVVRIVTEGTVSVWTVISIVGVAVLFLVLTAYLGGKFGPPLFRAVQKHSRSAGTLVAVALAFTLFFAELADAAKLAPIIGAFVAGLSLSRSDQRERIERDLTPVGHLFIPVFFLAIGIAVDVSSFVQAEVLEVAGALAVVAIVGKLFAAVGAIGSPGDKTLIGLGMLPRGEVGLIFATIGLREGVLGENLYASLLLVVLITTLMAPPLLRWRLQQLKAGRRPKLAAGDPMPEGGWLGVVDGTVDVEGDPPSRLAVTIGLEAALAIADGARPGRALLGWLGSLDDESLRWDRDATQKLFEVLLRGNDRAWRFLESSGVLQRALPELADSVERRRADPHLLDSSQVLRFELVENIRGLAQHDPVAAAEQMRLEHPEWLLLAALILDTAGQDSEPVALARRLVQRLDLGAAAEQEIALLVGNPGLLRAAAGRVDGLDEESVLKLASHLERPERAQALYLMSLALGPLERVERARLDELLSLVVGLLELPSVTGLEVRNLVEQRRAEAVRLVATELQKNRVEHAPRAYLLSQKAEAVARQVRLLDHLPGRNEASVALYSFADGVWEVDVASRDRPALLAHVTGVLVDYGLDIESAVIATWADGAALESFTVRRAPTEYAGPEQLPPDVPPDPRWLEAAIVASFDHGLNAPPNPEARVTFDDAGSPWYTLCEVRGPDRRGLLHTITVGIAAAGANVHSARVETVDGVAVDRFELTDATGRKLDDETKEAVEDVVLRGVSLRKKRFGRLVRT